jgi:dienelactone hydrolase
MADVLLIHSVRGLRSAERDLADRMRAAGHEVHLPDLFDGATSASVEGGQEILERLGWAAVVERARAAAAGLPDTAVLAGVSIGAQIAGALLSERAGTTGILLLHGPCEVPAECAGLPVQAHLAEPDPFDDEAYLADWSEAMRMSGADFQLHRYPGVGHYFTDATLPDYEASAAELALRRSVAFLAHCDTLRRTG